VKARNGSALVWTALLLMLLPLMLALSIDGADVVSAHQALQAALTEAWEAVGAPTAPPSAGTLATLTVLCRENLPASVHLTTAVTETSQGLRATAAVAVPVPLGSTSRWTSVGQLPIAWTGLP
jgi:Flp pilus assembly protein TadG